MRCASSSGEGCPSPLLRILVPGGKRRSNTLLLLLLLPFRALDAAAQEEREEEEVPSWTCPENGGEIRQ